LPYFETSDSTILVADYGAAQPEHLCSTEFEAAWQSPVEHCLFQRSRRSPALGMATVDTDMAMVDITAVARDHSICRDSERG